MHIVRAADRADGAAGWGDVQAWAAAAVADGLLVLYPELHPAARAEARWVRAGSRAGRVGKVLGDLARSQSSMPSIRRETASKFSFTSTFLERCRSLPLKPERRRVNKKK